MHDRDPCGTNYDSHSLQEIDCEQSGVKECFTVMLECWLSRNNPAPTWNALIDALKSDMIERGDIAQVIEARSKGEEPATSDDGRLSLDKHLKEVINATSKLKAEWRDLGMELGITPTKLRVGHTSLCNAITNIITYLLSILCSTNINFKSNISYCAGDTK